MSDQPRVTLFDEWAERYDTSVRSSTGLFQGYDQVLDRVVLCADARPGMRVLDLGIGTGNLARRFVALGCEVWGVDFSSAMLTRARAKVPHARLIQMDLMWDVWPEALSGQRFDRIASAYVFHEFDLPAKVRLVRRLADDHLAGRERIIVGDVAFPSLQALQQAGADHWDEDEHYWVADGAIVALEEAGLLTSYEQVSGCGGVFTISYP